MRIVIGLEPPSLATIGHQEDLAVLETPLRRREGRLHGREILVSFARVAFASAVMGVALIDDVPTPIIHLPTLVGETLEA